MDQPPALKPEGVATPASEWADETNKILGNGSSTTDSTVPITTTTNASEITAAIPQATATEQHKPQLVHALSTPGLELPGAFPRDAVAESTTNAADSLPDADTVRATVLGVTADAATLATTAVEAVKEQLPAQEDVAQTVSSTGETVGSYVPATHDVTSTLTSVGEAAAGYIPQGLKDTVAAYLPGATATTDAISASDNDITHEKSLPTDEGNNLLSHSIPDVTKSEAGLARLPDDNSSSATGNAPSVTVGATGLAVPHEADLGSGTTNATADDAGADSTTAGGESLVGGGEEEKRLAEEVAAGVAAATAGGGLGGDEAGEDEKLGKGKGKAVESEVDEAEDEENDTISPLPPKAVDQGEGLGLGLGSVGAGATTTPPPPPSLPASLMPGHPQSSTPPVLSSAPGSPSSKEEFGTPTTTSPTTGVPSVAAPAPIVPSVGSPAPNVQSGPPATNIPSVMTPASEQNATPIIFASTTPSGPKTGIQTVGKSGKETTPPPTVRTETDTTENAERERDREADVEPAVKSNEVQMTKDGAKARNGGYVPAPAIDLSTLHPESSPDSTEHRQTSHEASPKPSDTTPTHPSPSIPKDTHPPSSSTYGDSITNISSPKDANPHSDDKTTALASIAAAAATSSSSKPAKDHAPPPSHPPRASSSSSSSSSPSSSSDEDKGDGARSHPATPTGEQLAMGTTTGTTTKGSITASPPWAHNAPAADTPHHDSEPSDSDSKATKPPHAGGLEAETKGKEKASTDAALHEREQGQRELDVPRINLKARKWKTWKGIDDRTSAGDYGSHHAVGRDVDRRMADGDDDDVDDAEKEKAAAREEKMANEADDVDLGGEIGKGGTWTKADGSRVPSSGKGIDKRDAYGEGKGGEQQEQQEHPDQQYKTKAPDRALEGTAKAERDKAEADKRKRVLEHEQERDAKEREAKTKAASMGPPGAAALAGVGEKDAKEEAPEGLKEGGAMTTPHKKPRFMDRVKGEIKALSGKFGGDKAKVEEGKKMVHGE